MTSARRSWWAVFALSAGVAVGAAYLAVRVVERLRSGPVDPAAIVSEAWVRLYGRIALSLWMGLPMGGWIAGRLTRGEVDEAVRTTRLRRAVIALLVVAPLIAWRVP